MVGRLLLLPSACKSQPDTKMRSFCHFVVVGAVPDASKATPTSKIDLRQHAQQEQCLFRCFCGEVGCSPSSRFLANCNKAFAWSRLSIFCSIYVGFAEGLKASWHIDFVNLRPLPRCDSDRAAEKK